MDADKFGTFLECVEKSFENVAKDMADIIFQRNDKVDALGKDTVSVIIGVVGANKGRILIEMERSAAKVLAESINGEPFDNYLELYLALMEFSNIFCGNAVTLINNTYRGSDLRLTPPAIFAGVDVEIMTPNIGSKNVLCKCEYGDVLLDIGFEGV